MNYKKSQKGSIITYILVAIFLSGLLISILTQGARKNIATTHLDKMALFLNSDIKVIHSAITECIQIYNDPVDVDNNGTIDTNDNPNPVFPLYDDLSSGGLGVDFHLIKCPGAPTSQQNIFEHSTDKRIKLLADNTNYTTTYITDSTEGAYIRITSNSPDFMWEEVIKRVDAKVSQCSATIEVDMGTCANSCLYYWILRHPTSTIGAEVGCP